MTKEGPQILVYKLASPASLVRHSEKIAEIVHTATEVWEDEGVCRISNAGELSLVREEAYQSTGVEYLSTDADVDTYWRALLLQLDDAFSSDSELKAAGFKSLFAQPYLRDASPLYEGGNLASWRVVLGMAAPTGDGTWAKIANASVEMEIDIDETLRSFTLTWRPIIAQQRENRFPLFLGVDESGTKTLGRLSLELPSAYSASSTLDQVTIQYVYSRTDQYLVPTYCYEEPVAETDEDRVGSSAAPSLDEGGGSTVTRFARIPACDYYFSDYVF